MDRILRVATSLRENLHRKLQPRIEKTKVSYQLKDYELITPSVLKEIYQIDDKTAERWAKPIADAMYANGIDTTLRMCAFLAQIGHESNRLRSITENLNYSTTALRSVFGKYFPDTTIANQYARQPEKIANRVYANRMGNGAESSGDGWKYRGRGLIQLTGKNNYTAFSKWSGVDCVANPDQIVEDENLCVLSAVWYWNTNNLSDYADREQFETITRRINGGLNGQVDRVALYERAKIILNKF